MTDNDVSRAAFVKGQLTLGEADMLRSYRQDRARIWDAVSLMPTVFRLRDLGLIYQSHEDIGNRVGFRLTPLGVAVQSCEW